MDSVVDLTSSSTSTIVTHLCHLLYNGGTIILFSYNFSLVWRSNFTTLLRVYNNFWTEHSGVASTHFKNKLSLKFYGLVLLIVRCTTFNFSEFYVIFPVWLLLKFPWKIKPLQFSGREHRITFKEYILQLLWFPIFHSIGCRASFTKSAVKLLCLHQGIVCNVFILFSLRKPLWIRCSESIYFYFPVNKDSFVLNLAVGTKPIFKPAFICFLSLLIVSA